ncbi:MAG: CoA-binding protein [Thermodesulfobacteriota bacterium]
MLHSLFHPRSVAVIGASKGVTATGSVKIGHAALKYLLDHGYSGRVYPVNPKEKEILGLRSYPSLEAVPEVVDLACLVVPASACVSAMRECVEKGVRAAVVFSSGFAEAGQTSLQQRLLETARGGGLRFVGPNTAGIINVNDRMVASISMSCEMPAFRPGEIAFITQSGALGGSMLSRGMDQGVGFSYWVSSGNEADLDTSDYIEYLLGEDTVKAFTLFTEGLRDGAKFKQACLKAARCRKPIVMYKTGLSEVSAAAARSHTGALAGSDQVFDKVARQYGVVRVDDVADLFQTALAFTWLGGRLPRGRRMGIVTASGGICGVGADECHLAGLEIPELTGDCQAEISRYVPSFAAIRNPVDVTGQIRSSQTGYQDTVRCVLAQDYIDGLLLLVTMAAEPRASFYGQEISRIARETNKPVIVAWTGAVSLAPQGFPMLHENKVPHFLSVREAVKVMRALADYQAFLDRFEASTTLKVVP